MAFSGCSTHPSPKVLEQGAESLESHLDRSRISLWDSPSAMHRAAPWPYPAQHHPMKQRWGRRWGGELKGIWLWEEVVPGSP